MTLEGDSLCLATFTTSPSVVSISTSASETGFVVGDHITIRRFTAVSPVLFCLFRELERLLWQLT